ncbi:uncharacterized protein JCM10292_007527 [Rhodotorula paludigena]|uniref:uncharacterized protein n=1 Tax=Rhodotorula paludigena TaxID=86838 RepID=UPI00317CE3B7
MAAALYAASPALGGSSPNSPAIASPARLRTSPRKGKAAASPSTRSPRKERLARRDSALGAKDANGDGSLLVDFGDDCAVSNAEAVFPRTPSAFARSLLDKTPSLLKAQLSTPLIPLGTPVTTRKGRNSSPSKENATPTTRDGARRLDHSPSPNPADSPASTSSVPSSSAQSVRYSPSPRRLRSSPRKPALGAPVHFSASPATPPSYASASPARSSPLATPLHRVGLATPSRPHPLATASPFPLFSPSTPATRTHASYREDELTNCDADGSLYDLDEEERSMSFPLAVAGTTECGQSGDADDQVDEVIDAVRALSLAEQPILFVSVGEDGALSDMNDGETEEDSLDELTETELATSASEDEAGREEDAMVSSAELDGAAGVSDATGEIEDSNVEDDSAAMGSVVGAEPVLTAVDEESQSGTNGPTLTSDLEGAREADEEYAAIEADNLLVEAPTAASSIEVEPSACGDAVVNDEQVSGISPEPSASEGTAVADEASASVGGAEEIASSAPTSPLSEGDTAPDSFNATQESVEAAAEHFGTPQPSSPDGSPALPLHLAPSTPCPDLPSLRFTSPATPPPPSTEALTEPSATPNAFKTAKVQVTDAPTARRQLTKLTSGATARAASANAPGSKATLTSLIPGSAAASSRRLPASRLALPKRTTLPSTIAEASPASLRAIPAVENAAVEYKRPPSALSASSASSSSAASSTATKPRTLSHSGLKPPGAASSTSGLARPTLASSARALAGAAAPKPTASAAPRLTRPLTVPRPPVASTAAASSRLARSETAASTRPALTASNAQPPRAVSSLSSTSSAPHVLSRREPVRPTSSLAALSAGRAPPRAALAVRQAPAPSPLPSVGASPRRAVRTALAKTEAPRRAVPVAVRPAPPPPPAASPERAETPTLAPPATSAALPTHLSPLPSPSPFQPPIASPPRAVATRPPGSPLRSPRRVPINSQDAAPGPVTTASVASALVAPAARLAAAAPPALFEPIPRSAAPRAVRARRTRATEAEVLAAAVPTVTPAPLASIAATTRTTRRAAAAAAPSGRAQPPPPPVAPVARSARRPTRREPSIEETPAEPTPPAATQLVEEEPLAAAAPAQPRAAPHFHAAPAVTQDELNRLTQRNTKKNQQPFNKLKLETVYLDENRPASPTSKIRKSFGSAGGGALEQASTKEGREARAAKRRNALRASADGSELEAFAAELRAEKERTGGDDETAPLVPRAHFRAAGDDEQYETPLRGPTTLKSKAAAAKKRSSASPAGAAEGEPRRVRWDRALVYEGPREGETPAPDSSILRPSELDDWGNSTVANASLGKAVPVLICMRVFKDDEQ